MEQNDFMKKFWAGIFFIVSIIAVVGIVFRIGGPDGFSQSKFEVTVYYYRVGGLVIGAPVTISGVHVGTVQDIDFVEPEIDGRGVKVVLSILKRYEKQVHKGVSFAIKTEGVLGEKIVEITTDPSFYREDISGVLFGQDPLDVQDLAETFGETAKSLSETSKRIDAVTQDMKTISGTTTRMLNRIEQRLIDGNLFKVF